MKTDFSASASGKTTTGAATASTPFDKIATLEKQENERVRKEIAAMEEETKEVEVALKEKEEIGEQEIKEAAREDLKEYRETELNTIVKTAEKDAEKEAKDVEKHYSEREEAVVKRLTGTVLNKDLPLLQS